MLSKFDKCLAIAEGPGKALPLRLWSEHTHHIHIPLKRLQCNIAVQHSSPAALAGWLALNPKP